MGNAIAVRKANLGDVPDVVRTLQSNSVDVSLFQQPPHQVQRNISEFVVATNADGAVVGCAQVHRYRGGVVEILAVSVHPDSHGLGIGTALMQECIGEALTKPVVLLWLATAKPAYFANFGFAPISKWDLPIGVLLHKLRLIFQQPVSRWVPAIIGRHAFMKSNTSAQGQYAAQQGVPPEKPASASLQRFFR